MKKSCPTSPHNAGFILPMTLLFLLIVGISLSGVFGYTNYVTRSMARSSSETICRLAAQSVVEEAKQEIYKQFSDYYKKEKYLFSASLDTFFTTTTESNAVGPAGYSTTYPTAGVTRNGCTVKVTFSAYDVTSDRLRQDLVIRAQATTTTPLGQKVSRTIEETAAFVLAQSEVFDYAYFINNFGYFLGSKSVVNGDARANGDFNVNSGAVINGRLYASINKDINSNGTITNDGTTFGTWQSGFIYSIQKDTRSRPLSNYVNDENDPSDDVSWAMGYDPSVRSDPDRKNGLYDASQVLPMPYLGDLKDYIALAKGTVSVGTTGITQDDMGHFINPTINGVYKKDQDGPSRNVKEEVRTEIVGENINVIGNIVVVDGKTVVVDGKIEVVDGKIVVVKEKTVAGADKGCVVLIGDEKTPIKLDGTVVVEGDVLIGGYVEGQGAIYAGRNIHILGNIIYKNPPTWGRNETGEVKQTEEQLIAQAEANAKKDLLVLAAKGNIVIGDCSNTPNKQNDWLDEELKKVIKPDFVNAYTCDASDKDIGYNSPFPGDYTALDGGKRVVTQKGTGVRNQADRHFYESSVDATVFKKYATPTKDIEQIDSVLYTNHAIIGQVSTCSFNGALISRNEALLYMGKITFNWDIRLGSRSRDNLYLRNRGINPNNIVHMPLAPKSAQLVRWCEYLK